MKLGIVSDVHDALDHLRTALASLDDVGALLVAGDLCSPFVLPILANGYESGPIHVVFGNNDGDRFRMARVAAGHGHLHLHGEAFDGTVAGRRVAMNHFPELAAMTDDGRYDLIVSGHDHRLRVARSGRAWRLNPGSLLGYDPAAGRHVAPTFLTYDVDEDRVAAFELRADGRADAAEGGPDRDAFRAVPRSL